MGEVMVREDFNRLQASLVKTRLEYIRVQENYRKETIKVRRLLKVLNDVREGLYDPSCVTCQLLETTTSGDHGPDCRASRLFSLIKELDDEWNSSKQN